MALFDNPLTAGLFGGAAALLQPRRVGLGDGIAGFMGAANNATERNSLLKRNDVQTQLLLMQLEEQKRAQEIDKQRRAAAAQFAQNPAQQAASLPGGPTVANAAQIPNMPGGFDAAGYQRSLLGSGDIAGAAQVSGFLPKKPEPFTLGEGQTRYGPDGKPIASVAKPQNYNDLVIAGPDGKPMINPLALQARREVAAAGASNISFGAPMPAVNPKTGKVELMRPDNRGGMTFTGVKPAPTDRDIRPTDGQSNAALYASRMEEADKLINDLEGKYNRYQLAARQAAGQGVLGTAANSMVSSEVQKVDQAQRNFINAVLRRESGAVIADPEFKNAAIQYFPQPGDSIEVVRQKAANRRTAIEGIKAAGAPAFAAREQTQERQQAPQEARSVDELLKMYGAK